MRDLLLPVARISIVLLVTFALLPLLRRRSAALRAWVLAVGLATAAFVPLLQLVAPAWGMSLIPPADMARSESPVTTAAPHLGDRGRREPGSSAPRDCPVDGGCRRSRSDARRRSGQSCSRHRCRISRARTSAAARGRSADAAGDLGAFGSRRSCYHRRRDSGRMSGSAPCCATSWRTSVAGTGSSR